MGSLPSWLLTSQLTPLSPSGIFSKTPGALPSLLQGLIPHRKVFVSYDHDDTDQMNGFLGLRNLDVGVDFINKKLDYEIQSKSDEYKRRVIREKFIRGASVTVILIGVNYWMSKWSDWEIQDSIIEGNGLLAIALKGVTQATLPSEFKKYYDAGLARFQLWEPPFFGSLIEEAYQNRAELKKYDEQQERLRKQVALLALLGRR